MGGTRSLVIGDCSAWLPHQAGPFTVKWNKVISMFPLSVHSTRSPYICRNCVNELCATCNYNDEVYQWCSVLLWVWVDFRGGSKYWQVSWTDKVATSVFVGICFRWTAVFSSCASVDYNEQVTPSCTSVLRIILHQIFVKRFLMLEVVYYDRLQIFFAVFHALDFDGSIVE